MGKAGVCALCALRFRRLSSSLIEARSRSRPARRANPLGIIIYEMLAGAAPFHAKAAMAFMRQHMVAEPPELRSRVPLVSKELHELVHAMLAKEPQERPDMTQVGEQLRRIAGPSRVGDTLVVGDEPPRFALRGSVRWLAGAGLAIVVLLGVLGLLLRQVLAPPKPPVPAPVATPEQKTVAPTPGPRPALDMAKAAAPVAVPPKLPTSPAADERLDAGADTDGPPADAAEPDLSQRPEVEPSPAPAEPTEPPPSSPAAASHTAPHTTPPRGKRPGKTTPSRPDRHHGKQPRGKHGRTR